LKHADIIPGGELCNMSKWSLGLYCHRKWTCSCRHHSLLFPET